jgi:hypothetical protein
MENGRMLTAPPDEAAIKQIFQLITGFWRPPRSVLRRRRVADHLADGPRSAAGLAARTGANEDALYRMLRALAVTGVFAERRRSREESRGRFLHGGAERRRRLHHEIPHSRLG